MKENKFKIQNYLESPKISEFGFREYDARWLYPDQINLSGIKKIGSSLGVLMSDEKIPPKIIVGHDYRSYSEEVKEALISGLLLSGVDVYDIGLTVSPGAYFSQFYLECKSVAMVTASHNKNGWTGFKMGIDRPLTFGPDLMKKLKEISLDKEVLEKTEGKYKYINGINEEYIRDLTKNVKIKRKIKAVVACGNGTSGIFAPEVLEKIGVEVIKLHCDLDYNFPFYNPNPEDLVMLKDLSKEVTRNNADIGFAFDGDGDRCGYVDNNGIEIYSDIMGVLLARSLSSSYKNSKFVVDVKSTGLYSSDKELKSNNASVKFWKTGHSYIKQKTLELNALAGFERSGHYFFNSPIGRGYDDACLSAIEVCKLLDKNFDKSISDLKMELPKTYNSPTMSPECPDDKKYKIVEDITKIIEEKSKNNTNIGGQKIASILKVNGVRFTLEDGSWGLVRASSNTPNLVVVCESQTSEDILKKIFQFIDKILKEFKDIGPYDQSI
tara:strand:- start:1144 stop:2628 length:1485 start_codon:yes stop_codon:yes gene_type:complete